MRKSALFSWGKSANKLRYSCYTLLDSHPQFMLSTTFALQHTVYKPVQFPIPSILCTRRFPLANFAISPLLNCIFSPLSTPPITITTNVKSKER